MKKSNSEEKWHNIICRCKNSGFPVKKWCTENNINLNTYRYWNTRINKSEENIVQWAEIKPPVIEENTIQVYPQKQTSFTICLKDFSVKVEEGFDQNTLAELLGFLRSVC